MALTQRELRNQTERLKRHYGYILDELELAMGTIERLTALVSAHQRDLECKEQKIPASRKGKAWNAKPAQTSISKGSRRTKR